MAIKDWYLTNPDFTGVNGKRVHFDDSPVDTDATLLQDVAPTARNAVLRNLHTQKIAPRDFRKVLHVGPEVVPPPFALKDSQAAAAVFVDAIESLTPANKMAIWGDYDVDGNTSSTVLGTLARQLNPQAKGLVKHYIPHRREGFGPNIEGIKKLADDGVTSLFIVDSGTVAYKEIEYARSRGMKVVVIDHHQPHRGEALPEGALVINPHRLDENVPELTDLSAAGLSWLFAKDVEETLRKRHAHPPVIDHGLITVAGAIGTVSDVMDVRSPINRYIIDQGLKEMATGRYPGIEALKGLFGIHKIRESDIGFSIGPSINAAGRMNDPTVGMRMLLTQDQREAEKLAKELTAYNDERKQFSNQIILGHALEEADAFMKAHPGAPIILIEDEHWMSGVVGIIASRIKERYGVPTLLGTRKKKENGSEQISYSARSIEDVHLFNAVNAIRDKIHPHDIVKFGGHAMAAGLTIKAAAKDRVVNALFEELKKPVQEARANDSVKIAAEMAPEDLTVDTVGAFYQFGAYGSRMTAPRILVRNVQVKQVRPMGNKGEHLSVALGGEEATAPYESLRYGTAFRAPGTALGKMLLDPNRHNQQFDAVIEPYIFEKKNGETAVGYHLIDASPARVVGHDPNPNQVLEAHLARIQDFKAKQEADRAKTLSLPRKIQHLLDGSTDESQAVLEFMYKTRLCKVDTETTGLKAGNPDHLETEGITQVAISKAVPDQEKEGRYKYVERVYPILPVTPAYFEYQRKRKIAEKNKEPLPPYDKSRFEYEITQKALEVTGTEFVREYPNGPIKDMLVGGHKVDAKPFYEQAQQMAEFLGDTVPAVFNAPFDARVVKTHFEDVLKARALYPHDPELDIRDEKLRNDYARMTKPLANMLEEGDGADFMYSFSDPRHYVCLMRATLLDKGEKPFNNLDNAALLYDIDFLRAPDAHDAREDNRPLPYMAYLQAISFARKELKRRVPDDVAAEYPKYAAEEMAKLVNKRRDMQELWQTVARESDPDATVEAGVTQVEKKKNKKTIHENVRHLKLTFPSAPAKGHLPDTGEYLASLLPAQARNSDIPKLVLAADDKSVSVDASAKDSGDIPLFTSFNKSLCVDRLYRSGMVSKIRAFDSTSKFDITLAPTTLQPAVTIEDVPISGLRKSLDFLLSDDARPYAKDYLELMRWFDAIPHAGLTTFDESGITVRGLQRGFGETRMTLPPGEKLIDHIDDIKSRARDLLSIASLPGARKTDYIVENEDSELENKRPKDKGVHFSVDYRLDKPGSMLMDVSLPLLKLVAQEKNIKIDGDHFTWPGGVVGQRAEEGDHYLLNGSLETFAEVGSDLRNAAWLLHRFNQLPGVRASKTELHEDGTLTLTCDEGVPVETAWILHRSHVPFKATNTTVEIAMPELMHDAYHWYWELRKDQKFVENEVEKKIKADRRKEVYERKMAIFEVNPEFFDKKKPRKPSGMNDSPEEEEKKPEAAEKKKDTPQEESEEGEKKRKKIEEPPFFLQALKESLRDGTAQNFETDRAGKAFASVGSYPLVPVNPDVRKDAFEHRDPKKPLDSPLFKHPEHAGIQHTGLSVRLAQLQGVQKNYSHLARAEDGDCVLTTPTLDPLSEREMLVEKFRDITRLARSAHINPLLDSLRDIVKTEDMQPHHADPVNGESPVTMERLNNLTRHIQKILPHLDPIVQDVSEFHENFHEVQLKDPIFRNVAALSLIQKTLSEAHAKGHLSVSGEEYDKMQASLREYYESLSMAEFKRYRLDLDGQEVVKSIVRLQEALHDQADILHQNSLYAPYLAHKEVSTAIEKLWDDGKRYKRTLHFSDEIIAASATLRDWRKLEAVQKAVELTHGLQNREVEQMLKKLKAEDGIKDFRQHGDKGWVFDSATMEKKPEYWDARIAELQKGKEVITKTPHVAIDTSTLLTLLLSREHIPGDTDAGHAGLLQDMIHHKLLTPVITGAVLAELLNSPVPLTPDDIFIMDKDKKAVGVKYTAENRRHVSFRQGHPDERKYPKWEQRLDMLKDLYNSGHLTVVATPTEKLYYNAIRSNGILQEKFDNLVASHPEDMRQAFASQYASHPEGYTLKLADVSNEELKSFLLNMSDARQKFMFHMRAAHIRQDIGEVSIGDALHALHERFGEQTPVTILYEGDDVRGRLLMRKAHIATRKDREDVYMAGEEKAAQLLPEFNPKHKNFMREHVQKLGNGRFLSTDGFYVGFMKIAKEHGAFIVSPEEHNHGIPADINNPPPDSYPGAIQRVRRNAGKAIGKHRSYNKIVDEHATELGLSPHHSWSITRGTPGPWQEYLASLDPSVMRTVLANHMMRERKFKEATLAHLGDSSAKTVRDILTIDKHLAAVAGITAPLQKPTEVQAKQEDAPFIMTDFKGPDPRAAAFASAILKQHESILEGSNGKVALRPRLPENLKLELLAVPAKWRDSVIEDTTRLLAKKLGSTPEELLYLGEYEALLRGLLPSTQRNTGRR